MKNKSKMHIGNGWRQVSSFACEEFLMASNKACDIDGDEAATRKCLAFWFIQDTKAGPQAKMLMESGNVLDSDPLFNPGRGEIIYVSDHGIMALSLLTKEKRQLIPFDWDSHVVERLWLSQAEPATLFYLLAKRSESLSSALAKAGGRPVKLQYEYSLHSWQVGTDDSELVTTFNGSLVAPWSVAVDLQRGTLFAMLKSPCLPNPPKVMRADMTEIDLRGGKPNKILRTIEGTSNIAISFRHNPVTWRSPDGGITEMLPDGEDISLSEFGSYPSFSGDGTHFAFTVGDHELWIKDVSQVQAEQIIAFPAMPNSHYCDTPTWCPCGKHFAVSLANPETGSGGLFSLVLAIVDCERKEIILSGRPWMPTFGQVWVPKSQLGILSP